MEIMNVAIGTINVSTITFIFFVIVIGTALLVFQQTHSEQMTFIALNNKYGVLAPSGRVNIITRSHFLTNNSDISFTVETLPAGLAQT